MNLLQETFKYYNLSARSHNRLQELIYDFEIDNNLDTKYIIHADNAIYGLISVETRASLNEWFNNYHDNFIKSFDLKLIRASYKEVFNRKVKRYKLIYTFTGNTRCDELDYNILLDDSVDYKFKYFQLRDKLREYIDDNKVLVLTNLKDLL